MGPSVISVGQAVDPTTLGPWRLLISMPIFIKIGYQYADFHQNRTGAVFPYPDNGTFGDLCRSNGGSYDFGPMETLNQHAKFYRYAEFHQNRTGAVFP